MNPVRTSTVAVLFLAFALYAAPVPKAAPADEERILGTWKLEKLEGVELPEDEVKKIRFVFKSEGQFAVIKGEDSPKNGTFKIDSKTQPKSLDITQDHGDNTPGRLTPCIYEFDGDTLRICMTEGMNAARPTEFKIVNKRDAVITLKRLTDEKK